MASQAEEAPQNVPAEGQVGPGGKLYKRPSKVACLACRKIKVKCKLPNDQAPTGIWAQDQSRCTRCIRLDLPCEYRSAPRLGRRPKDRSAEGAQPASKLARSVAAAADNAADARERNTNEAALALTLVATRSDAPPHYPSLPSMYNLPHPPGVAADPTAPTYSPTQLPLANGQTVFPTPSTSQHPSSGASSTVLPFPPQYGPPGLHDRALPASSSGWQSSSQGMPALAASAVAHHSASPAYSLSSGIHPSPASSASVVLERNTFASLAEAAEVKLYRSSLFGNGVKGKKVAARMADPVDLSMLSEFEAGQLVDNFHTSLNRYIILLDPHLHSLDFIRRTSPILLSAVLAVSAKFFRKDLYPQLLQHAQQLVMRAMGGDGSDGIGLVQALLILCYWKEPMDSSAWLKIGYAIRLGFQLGLHVKRTTPLPTDDLAARVLLDRERCWIVLICFDASHLRVDETMADSRMIRHCDVDIDAWLDETRKYDVQDDAEQAVSMSLVPLNRLYQLVAAASSPAAARTLASYVQNALNQAQAKYLDPQSPKYRPLTLQAANKAQLHLRTAAFSTAQACLAVIGPGDPAVLAEYLARATDVVDSFERFAADEMLSFSQDAMAIRLLDLGEGLGKLFPRVDANAQVILISLMSRVYAAASRSKNGSEDSPPAFIARFFRAALQALHPGCIPATGPPSRRMSSPEPAQDAEMGPVNQQQQGEAGGPGQASAVVNPFDQLQNAPLLQEDLLADLPLDALAQDLTYWDSLNSVQALSSWAWLDQALNSALDGAGAGEGGFRCGEEGRRDA
ncbi:Protein priB [Rhodotorula toruloides]|nr:Protein priB [Rhodotorula toruloides]